MFSNHEMCEITVPVNHYDVITFHWKSSANPRWNYTGNGRILRGSAAIRGGIKIFRGGIISGQVSGIAGGSQKSSAGVGGLVKIPLDCTVFHNLKGYDSHFIIQKLHATKGNITCIANNAEKYISFSVAQLKFLDSFQFMASSLEKLVQSTIGSAPICPKCQKETEETTIDENWLLTAQCTKCKSVRTKQLHKSDLPITVNNVSENAHLIAGKGFYPYEYIDSHERFKETELPPMEAFYSKLTNETISAKNYEHAQTVWKKFNCQTLGDYHDLYLKSDVLLLADVFQTFRKTCMEAYKLDPLHYYTAPGLSWDALLKYTKIDLELLTDMDMHLFIEKGMRGGISMVSKRHAKANNPYTADYDSKITNNYIMYYDANNLYGWAMSQPLPYSGFKWYDMTDMTDKSKFKKNQKTKVGSLKLI